MSYYKTSFLRQDNFRWFTRIKRTQFLLGVLDVSSGGQSLISIICVSNKMTALISYHSCKILLWLTLKDSEIEQRRPRWLRVAVWLNHLLSSTVYLCDVSEWVEVVERRCKDARYKPLNVFILRPRIDALNEHYLFLLLELGTGRRGGVSRVQSHARLYINTQTSRHHSVHHGVFFGTPNWRNDWRMTRKWCMRLTYSS